MNQLMDTETYDALRRALANAHAEDFVNLVTVALMDRADTEYVSGPDELSGRLVVLGETSGINPAMRYPDRDFTVVIRAREI